MKIVFLAINLLFISFIGLSQSSDRKIKLGVTFSPQSYFSKDIISALSQGYEINQSEFNYSIGVTVLSSLNNRFDLVTGLAYSSKDFTGTFFCPACSYFAAPQPELIKLRYLEVPISVRYFFWKGNVMGFGETGLVNGFSVNEKPGDMDSPLLERKKYILSGLIGMGLQASLRKKIDLSGSLFLQSSFIDTFKNSESKFQSMGITAMITRQL
jgi:hypothetical protein